MEMRKGFQWRTAVCAVLACLVLIGGTAWALMDGLVWPEATGEAVDTSDRLTIDYSHVDQGYVMAHGPSTSKQLRLVVNKDGNELQYTLNGNEEWEIIPLQFGDGNYNFTLAIQASGYSFQVGGKMTITAEFENANSVYLIPNQYVAYSPENEANVEAMEKSDELCEGLTTDEEKFEAIRAYMKENYTYDFDKARTVTGGTLPSAEYAWEKGMGICQDLAALAACMLRVQGVPVKLEIGYLGGNYYHAWNSVYLNGEWVRYDPTMELNAIPTGYSYSLQRWY